MKKGEMNEKYFSASSYNGNAVHMRWKSKGKC